MTLTYGIVLDKIISTIESCETDEQLLNTYRWAYHVVNNRHLMKTKKSLYVKNKAVSFGEGEGIVVTIAALCNRKYKKLIPTATDTFYDFVERSF